MTKIWYFLVIAAISMLSMVGCGEDPLGLDDPNNQENPDDPIINSNKDTVSFTLSNAFNPPLAPEYDLIRDAVSVYIFCADSTGMSGLTQFSFTLNSGGTRMFIGDSAKLFLGRKVLIASGLNIKLRGCPTARIQIYLDPIQYNARVEKKNNYSFVVYDVEYR